MTDHNMLTEAQADFLNEIMNIGAGNAAAALSQLLNSDVDVKIPAVYTLPPHKVPSVIGEVDMPVVCVKFSLVGDARGDVFFILPEREKALLAYLAEKAALGALGLKKNWPTDLSVLEEIGNIITGTYLTAVHDFCKLNIYHSVPVLKRDMLQALLDEALINLGQQTESFIVIESEFIIAIKGDNDKEAHIRTFLLIVPSLKSIDVMADSFKKAMTE